MWCSLLLGCMVLLRAVEPSGVYIGSWFKPGVGFILVFRLRGLGGFRAVRILEFPPRQGRFYGCLVLNALITTGLN